MTVRNLVAEHVNKFYTGCFENLKIIDLLFLKLWHDELLNISNQFFRRYVDTGGSMSMSILSNSSSNEQVQE